MMRAELATRDRPSPLEWAWAIYHGVVGAVAGVSQNVGLLRRSAVVIIVSQTVLAVAAALLGAMLYADGSWFIYTIMVGDPWGLKWGALSTRAATFVLTVAPTLGLRDLLSLTPMQTTVVNGLIFYLVPVIQLAIATMLVWRRNPRLLIFPITSHILGLGLCFGFPSEITLGPGFLWIGLFLLERSKPPILLFLLCVLGLTFSHELMLPTMTVMSYAGWKRFYEQPDGRGRVLGWTIALLCALIAASMFYVRSMGGGVEADDQAIYVFDPRRIANNPTLWLACAFAPLAWLAASLTKPPISKAVFAAAVAVGLLAPVLLQPWINFVDGRYPMRTLLAILVLGLALLWLDPASRAPAPQGGRTPTSLRDRSLTLLMVAITALQLSSSLVFLAEWALARRGFERATAASAAPGGLQILEMEQAYKLMRPREALANRRTGVLWSAPFRSMLLAEGRPGVIFYEEANAAAPCKFVSRITDVPGPVSQDALVATRDTLCAVPPPNLEGSALHRLMEKLTGRSPKA